MIVHDKQFEKVFYKNKYSKINTTRELRRKKEREEAKNGKSSIRHRNKRT